MLTINFYPSVAAVLQNIDVKGIGSTIVNAVGVGNIVIKDDYGIEQTVKAIHAPEIRYGLLSVRALAKCGITTVFSEEEYIISKDKPDFELSANLKNVIYVFIISILLHCTVK